MPDAPRSEESVADVLRRRRAEPGDDGLRLGLTVDGGGMRGIVTASTLIGLQDQGLLGLFDAYYGVSAGAINLCYLLAGHAWEGVAIYYDHLATDRFLRMSRLLRARAAIDMGFVEEVLAEIVPLQGESLLRRGRTVQVAVSNLEAARYELLSDFATTEELRQALLCGAHLPLLGGRPRSPAGHTLMDGGLFLPAASRAAIDDGCTHILSVVAGVTETAVVRRPKWNYLVAGQIGLTRWRSAARYWAVSGAYFRDVSRLAPGERMTAGGSRVLRIGPRAGTHGVTRLTQDRGDLLAGARAGYEVGATLLDGAGTRYVLGVWPLTTPPDSPVLRRQL
jgi:predicted patatin/cPLA2 family phospholipase